MSETLKRQIISAHRQHPTWHAAKIASRLGCSTTYVRNTAYSAGIDLPRKPYVRDPDNTIERLGEAARDAGLTLKDIKQIAVQRTA